MKISKKRIDLPKSVFMRKIIKSLWLSLFVLSVLALSSCGSEYDAEKTANKFYKALNNEDYKAALDEIMPSAVEEFGGDDRLVNFLKSRNKYWGKIKSRKKYGSEIVDDDSIKLVSLNYIVVSERDTVYEILELISENDQEFKIYTYSFSAEMDDVTPSISSNNKAE